MEEIFATIEQPLEQVNAEELLVKLIAIRRELSAPGATVTFDFTTLSPANKHLVMFSTVNALINLVKQRI